MLLNLYLKSKSFVVPCLEILHEKIDYIIKHQLNKGFRFSSGFSTSLNPNWTILSLN